MGRKKGISNESLKDLTGLVFSRLTVIARFSPIGIKPIKWHCKCECGKSTFAYSYNLKRGRNKSCGCLNLENIKTRSTTHGCSGKNITYSSWSSMKTRCLNTENHKYKRYGAIGITICPQWIDNFENFLKDVGERPSKEYSLDRYPNNKGNYEPGNVRWATQKQQQNNRTNNILNRLI